MTGTRNEMKTNKILLLYHPMPNYYKKDDELSFGQETKKRGTGPSPTNLMGMEHQMPILRETGHPVFRCSSRFSRGVLKK